MIGKAVSEEKMFENNCHMHVGIGYIHDCRKSSDTKRLFSWQPFPMSKRLYTRLPCIKYKSVIYTAAVSHTKNLYTRLPCIMYKHAISTAAVSHAKWFLYTAAVHPV